MEPVEAGGIEINKDVVRRYVEAFNRCDLDRLRALHTPDAMIFGVLGWGGIDEVLPIWQELHESFALELQVEGLIAEGRCVAARYTERGKFVGPFRGTPPNGKPFELVAMEWFVVHDGRIARRWGARDAASLARQIGL